MRAIHESTRPALIVSAALVLAGALLTGCENVAINTPAGGLIKPAIALDLPEKYNTPDGMTMCPKTNHIILSVPNINDPNHPAVLLSISPTDEVTEIVKLPAHPDTKRAVPLGVRVGPDGHIYVSDSQGFVTPEHKSRLLRVVMKEGKAQKVEVLVTGMVFSNGLAIKGDTVYLCDSQLDPKAYPVPSGVYAFKISELSAAKPYKVKPGLADPHLAITFTTKNKDSQVGANGLGFDKEGNMLVCNFGDAQLIQGKMGTGGKVVSQKVVAEGQGMLCCDGLSVAPKTGEVYIADFLGNALHKVDLKTGKVTTVAKNGDTDGSGGRLDRPSEPCVRGDRVYVANIDLPLADNTYDKPHTISVVELERD